MSGTNERLINQYRDSPKLKALFNVLIDKAQESLVEAALPLLYRLDIDKMEGINLDYIGDIVGLPRPPSFTAEQEYLDTVFTYSPNGSPSGGVNNLITEGGDTLTTEDEEPLVGEQSGTGGAVVLSETQGYSSYSNLSTGGVYIASQTFIRMSDADYRRFLKAKILKNNSNGNVFDIEEFGKIVFSNPVEVDESTVGKVLVTLPYSLNAQALNTVVSTLPIAQGVELEIVYAS
jgi:hypothetical protein